MKFQNNEDKKMFLVELGKVALLESVNDSWEPSPELLELYISKRKELIPGLRNFRRSQASKGAWRSNRYNFVKGIRRFHKSTKGKRMHRALGDFLATREAFLEKEHHFDHGIYEVLKSISSLKTHAFIELEYYQPVDEYLEFTELLEELIPMIARVDSSFLKGTLQIGEEDLELLHRMVDIDSLIESYANHYQKSIDETKAAWTKCVSELAKEGKDEQYNSFYMSLVEKLDSKLK